MSGYNRLPDGKYEIYIDKTAVEWVGSKNNNKEKASTVIAGLKNIDGKRVWSYYKIVGNPQKKGN